MTRQTIGDYLFNEARKRMAQRPEGAPRGFYCQEDRIWDAATGEYGVVTEHGALYAKVAWEDGTRTEIDHHTPGIIIVDFAGRRIAA